jgi:hypothetical protein
VHEVHMKGIEKIIEAKGGMHTLGYDGALERAIYWYGCWTSKSGSL